MYCAFGVKVEFYGGYGVGGRWKGEQWMERIGGWKERGWDRTEAARAWMMDDIVVLGLRYWGWGWGWG